MTSPWDEQKLPKSSPSQTHTSILGKLNKSSDSSFKKHPFATGVILAVGSVFVIQMLILGSQKKDLPSNYATPAASSTTVPKKFSEKSNNGTSTPRAGQVDKKEMMALMMNANGHLCARVVGIRSLQAEGNLSEVECITYRGGDTRSTYIYNSETGVASAE